MAVPPVPIGMLFAYYAVDFAAVRSDSPGRVWRWLTRMASTAACAAIAAASERRQAAADVRRSRRGSRCASRSFRSGPANARSFGPRLRIARSSIDVGSSTISDVGRELVLPWFRAEHCGNVDKILLSHGDFDHISAAADSFPEQFNEPPVYISPHFARHAVGNFRPESLLDNAAGSAGRPPTIIHQGDHVESGQRRSDRRALAAGELQYEFQRLRIGAEAEIRGRNRAVSRRYSGSRRSGNCSSIRSFCAPMC